MKVYTLSFLMVCSMLLMLRFNRCVRRSLITSILICFRHDYPRDVVILHKVGGRGPFAPSISPFIMKMETYLRMAKIPYQVT